MLIKFLNFKLDLNAHYIQVEMKKECQESLTEALKKFENLVGGDYFLGDQVMSSKLL